MICDEVGVVLDDEEGDEDADEVQTHHHLELCDCLKIHVVALSDGQAQELFVVRDG